ncbi:MAG: SDR family NAD(P)-dependent oxidoreductase [Saprospiraceae bacterium]
MNNTKAYLIYCIDNQNIADKITNDLGRVGIDFVHDTFDPSMHNAVRQQYSNSTAPIFLLVSDNFLKSENCMRNILELVDDNRLRNRIKTVILEGRHRINGTNQYETVSTRFERLGDVVNYINHWSIQYQAIRTEMRHATDERKAELEPKLDLIQDISTNILGDFMRYLRATNYVSYNRLENDNFRQLFEEFGSQSTSLISEYRYLPAYISYDSATETSFSEVVEEQVDEVLETTSEVLETGEETIEDVVETTEEVVEEQVDEVLETTSEVLETGEETTEEVVEEQVDEVLENIEEPVDIDLSGIPGINLLPNVEKESADKNIDENLSDISDSLLDDLAEDLISDEDEDFIEDDILNEVFGDINEEQSDDETSSDALSDLIDELSDDILEENEIEEDEENDDIEGEHSVDELENEEESEDEVEGEPIEDLESPIVDEVEGESIEDNQVNVIDESTEELTDINDLIDNLADDLVNEMEDNNEEVDGENKEDIINEVLGSNNDEESEEANYDVDDLLSELTEDSEIEETEEEIEDLIDELTEDSETDDEIMESSTDIAEELAASGDVNAATGLYRQLVENDPENVDLRYAFAMMLIENDGNQALAKENLLTASKIDEDDEDILFALGAISEREGNFGDAKRYYEKVILLDLEHEQAYYRLGSLLANAFDNQQFVASSYLQRAISLDDEYAEAYFEYAKLLNTYFGKSKKAAKYFKKAVKNNRHFAEAHFELAKVYNKMGKENKALRHYEDAVEINNRFSTAENDARFGVQAESLESDTALASSEMEVVDNEPKGIILITGATSGIGRATAELFARNGYNLIITGRREERLSALKDILEAEFSTEILTLTFDVRNQEAVEAAVASLEGDWRNIDVLVNNAGLAKGYAPINEGQLTHWETMIDTNLKGLLYMTRAVSPLMVENSKGFIINIGSIAGKETYLNGNVYCATKAAVDALTKGMRLDLHHHNIRVTGIHPGHVETEFAIVRFDGDEERAKIYDDFQPLKAADVADTIYYVATRPAHVNIEDIVMWSTQQASATVIDKSGREKFVEN